MRIAALCGSRNRQGGTARALEAVLRGVSKAGGQWDSLFLTEHNLERCRQCNQDGWGVCLTEERCIIEDEFASIVQGINIADLIVFATPVYFHDLGESMKGFLDRLRRIDFPKILRLPGPVVPGQIPNGQGIPAIGVCYAGGSGTGTTSCCLNLERTLQTCGFDVVDMIPVRRQNLEMKLPLLEHVGAWLATKPTSGPPLAPSAIGLT
jgi:NAD(P)H-dependent FMN reductase